MASGNQGSTLVSGSYNAKTSNVGDLVVSGARVSTDVAGPRRQIIHIGEIQINEEVRPFTAFILGMGGARNKQVGQPVVQHNERDRIPTSVILDTTTYDNVSVTLNFLASTGAQIRPGTMLKSLRTGEMIFVSAKVDVDTATVTRAATGSGNNGAAAAALLASEELQIVGESFGQYSFAPAGVSVEPLIVKDRLQTFRTSVEYSGRDENSDVYGKDEGSRQLEDGLNDHNEKIEKAFLTNQGYQDTDGAAQTSTSTAIQGTSTDGMINRITTNVFTIGGVLTETDLENFFVACKRYNKSVDGLVAFTGEGFQKGLDGFARDAVRYTPETTVLGVKVKGWQCSFGDMMLKPHPLFGPIGSANSAANGGLIGSVLLVNPRNLGKLTFKGRGLKLEKNVQTPGQDGKKHCWTEDCGLSVWNERSHGYMSGITN